MHKPLGITGISPFAPANSPEYQQWRAARLENAEKAAGWGFLQIRDPKNLSAEERAEVLRRCDATNFALYQFTPNDDESDTRDSLRRLADARTSNPIESTFATVRHRTKKTKGCLGRRTALAMTFRLVMSAKKKWRKLDGAFRLPEIIEGVEFKDGIKQKKHAA